TYSRSDPSSQSAVVKEQIDPGFINDQYNLLFPYHLVWDGGITIEDAGMQKLPLEKGSAQKVVVKYSSEGGYTPGDTWNLFIEPDGRIRELYFQHGGPAKPSVFIAAFKDYKKAGPIVIALDHRGKADGQPARVFFTNVAVKLAGSDTWVDAK
ncbi:MAG TPA: hypothetical protein VG496_04850, partial [Myxococcales bacterium]|nr:hypothetical protein [Myxococcales bacterium]